jgi:hypothetical protein
MVADPWSLLRFDDVLRSTRWYPDAVPMKHDEAHGT